MYPKPYQRPEMEADDIFEVESAVISPKEQNHLLSSKSSSKSSQSDSKKSTTNIIKYASLFIVGMLVIFMISNQSNAKTSSNSFSKLFRSIQSPTETDYTLSVKVYSPDYIQLKSLSTLPWDVVAEPHREQTFSMDELIIGDEKVTITAEYTVEWILNDQIYVGQNITVTLTDTAGVYSGTVKVIPPSNSIHAIPSVKSASSFTTPKRKLDYSYDASKYSPKETSSYELDFTYALKYVRREIRQLTDYDRTLYFDTLKSLYETSDDDGKAIYGDKFKSIETFTKNHLYGAGKSDCDHWHDGAGIATIHVALTLEFEQSLQSVNPRIALPYWEYGTDEYIYDTPGDSEIFSKDWYGEMNPSNVDHKISDGSRWEGITVPDGSSYTTWDVASEGSLNPYVNARGVMRTPWNNNPSSFISRHNTTYSVNKYDNFPSCSTLYNCFDSTTLSDMNTCLNGATHGPVHIMVGGTWGAESIIDDFGNSFKTGTKLLAFKVLWRAGYTRCPSSCDDDSECLCTVPDEYINTYGAFEILNKTNILWTFLAEELIDDVYGHEESWYTGFLRGLQHPGVAGEMFASNAPYDPLFWPIHGSTDRLLAYKRILVSQDGVSFDETWGFENYSKDKGGVYMEGTCDWSGISSVDDLTLPTCDTSASCYGHGADDTMDFSNFLGRGETYTNSEFYSFMHPWNEELSYTYDTYDYDYCYDYADIDFLDSITPSSSALASSKTSGAKKFVYKGVSPDYAKKHPNLFKK